VARFVVPESLDGERADKIVAVLGEMSRAEARRLVDAAEVSRSSTPVSAKERLTAGEALEFEPPERDDSLVAEAVDFTVRYEDDHLLVVDKPAGLVVHPGAGRPGGTLAAGLLYRYPEIHGVGEDPRWGIVHRLDRDTSGLLVVARTQEAYRLLSGMIRRREVERGYLALVDGLFDAPRGTIDAPIAADPNRPKRRIVSPYGKPSRTHYRRVEAWHSQSVSLLEVTLDTGRTHQIRVHLSSINHPLVGDPVYGQRRPRLQVERPFLHAAQLAFDHPRTGERVTFHSELAPDLQARLDTLHPVDVE
jgi:23S rRNA pseudouridine1911/1915/1917 synthase